MKRFSQLTCLALGLCLIANTTFAKDGPPNWKLSAAGETEPANDGSFEDVDTFAGTSTHLGRFTGEGRHLLRDDQTFIGCATYTAANGDQLFVEYTGGIVGVDFQAAYPVLVEGEFYIVGGTGRLANAEGRAQMTGGFTGVPGNLFFQLKGNLHPQGK